MKQFDVTLITCSELLNPDTSLEYNRNVLLEDELLQQAFEREGLRVHRTNWDDPNMDWSTTQVALFRTTWDYFHRATEFKQWLESIAEQTCFINPVETIRWNMDKHYLQDLADMGLPVVATVFIEPGDQRSLQQICHTTGWEECVLKPAISGSARHTYRFTAEEAGRYEEIFGQLIEEETMMLQPFLRQVATKGEVSHMVFNGTYSHSILKRAKTGDFRVQDDHGGTVHQYEATPEEISLAERIATAVSPTPIYARVDIMWDNEDQPVLVELELLEPELWMRKKTASAEVFADAVLQVYYSTQKNPSDQV